jgi:hypothetical protein
LTRKNTNDADNGLIADSATPASQIIALARGDAHSKTLFPTPYCGGFGLMFGRLDIRQRYRRAVIGPFWITISMLVMVISLGVICFFAIQNRN